MRVYGLIAAIALLAVPLQPGIASAADKDDMMPAIDCSTANATMMKMMSPDMMAKPMAMDSSASLDKNFVMQMRMMSEHGMQMAKVEAQCGKDEKTRAMAKKMTEDFQDYLGKLGAVDPRV